jgi:hypothetical protein
MAKSTKSTSKPTKPSPKPKPVPQPAPPNDFPRPPASVESVVDQIAKQKKVSLNIPEGDKPLGIAKDADGFPVKGKGTYVPTKSEKAKMLEELAARHNTTPEAIQELLKVDDPNLAMVDPNALEEAPKAAVSQHKGARTPVKLKADYWMKDDVKDQWPLPSNNRAVAGTVVHLPIADARLLIDAGKAERADPLPGEAR